MERTFISLIFILVLLISLNFTKKPVKTTAKENSSTGGGTYIEISGDVRFPGIYNLPSCPSLVELLNRCGGLTFSEKIPLNVSCYKVNDGEKIIISARKRNLVVVRAEMNPFFKKTLGIPMSINEETAEGLTAIPGIGHKTALAIVNERDKRGGFKDLDEIMSVPGVGDNLYRKIMPFLKL
jgi:competence protein ComEA